MVEHLILPCGPVGTLFMSLIHPSLVSRPDCSRLGVVPSLARA